MGLVLARCWPWHPPTMPDLANGEHAAPTRAALEIAAILAAGYLRILRVREAKQREQANLRPPDSSLSPCYRSAVE